MFLRISPSVGIACAIEVEVAVHRALCLTDASHVRLQVTLVLCFVLFDNGWVAGLRVASRGGGGGSKSASEVSGEGKPVEHAFIRFFVCLLDDKKTASTITLVHLFDINKWLYINAEEVVMMMVVVGKDYSLQLHSISISSSH